MVRLKRVYEKATAEDGLRILVDRLWPRGVSKAAARIDVWLKGVAPSPRLRTWFGHDPARWTEFRQRYFAELKQHADAVAELRALIDAQPVTFVYAAKDPEYTHALALKDFVERKRKRPRAKKSTKRPPAVRRRAAPRRRS
jgi:uncharacterized protein YeaO (DUF488 family)